MDIGDLLVTLGLDASQFKSSMADAKDQASDSGNSIVGSLAAIGGGLVLGAMALAAGAIAGVTAALADCVSGAMNLQNIEAITGAELAHTGSISGVTQSQIDDLAGSMSSLTTNSYASVEAAGAVGARYADISSSTFPDFLNQAANMATTMGTDLPSAAQQLAKMLDDPGTSMLRLKQYGVEVTKSWQDQVKAMVAAGDTAGAQQMILDALNGSIGGVASAAANTASGQWQIFGNSISDIKDKIGAPFLGAIANAGASVNTFLNSPQVQGWVNSLVTGLTNIIGKVTDFISKFSGGFATWGSFHSLGDIIDGIHGGFMRLGETYPVFNTVATVFEKVVNIVTTLFNLFTTNQGAQIAAIAGISAALITFGVVGAIALWGVISPLLIAIGVMILVGLVVYGLYTAWTTNFLGIQTITEKVWDWLKTAFDSAKQWLIDAYNNVVTFVGNIVTSIGKINWNDLGASIINGIIRGIEDGAASLVNAAVKAATDAFNAVKGFLGIHSPSTLFGEIGQNMMLGMALGITGTAHIPAMAGVQAAAGVVNSTTSVTNNSPVIHQSFYGPTNAQAVRGGTLDGLRQAGIAI